MIRMQRGMARIAAWMLVLACLLSVLCTGVAAEDSAAAFPARPDTWAAVDGLGRTVSDFSDVGGSRRDKYVGMFYWTWHYASAMNKARNLNAIIQGQPDGWDAWDWNDPVWEGTPSGTPYFWNEPLFGYYTNTDEYVIRKHAELLADAGVDVIIFDCTNYIYTWPDGYMTVCKVFDEARKEGVRTPQIAFMLNFAAHENTVTMLKSLWRSLYGKGNYRDLWFMWEGKPLILAHPESLNPEVPMENEILQFFTFRRNEPSYYVKETAFDAARWGWCSVYPQGKYGVRADGSVEQMTVAVAQNANDYGLTNMNNPRCDVYGRGYAKDAYSYSYTYGGREIRVDSQTENALYYGLNFQQQWDYALSVDPDFIFVTGWNEWIVSRYQGEGYDGRPVNVFVDEYTDEYSRDIEPTKGELKDYFYYQLVDNVRRFKGVSEPDGTPEAWNVCKTVDIFGEEDAWADVALAYDHYIGSTRTRDCAGFGDLVYRSDTMRNDIVRSKVAYDRDFIYFMVETKDALSPATDPAWMRLLIDTDPSGTAPSWEGFEYIVNRTTPGEEAAVEVSEGGWSWKPSGSARYSVSGNRLQLAVPREALGLEDGDALPEFRFKWADNTRADGAEDDSGDILDFYQYGDVAPGGRFTFRFSAPLPAPEWYVPEQSEGAAPVPWYVYMCVGVVGFLALCVAGVAIFVRVSARSGVSKQGKRS